MRLHYGTGTMFLLLLIPHGYSGYYCTGGNYNLCDWATWDNWESCSRSCGGGTRYRSRGICCLTEFQISNDWYACLNNCGKNDKFSRETSQCNEFCRNGGIYRSGRCNCKSDYSGSCCERVNGKWGAWSTYTEPTCDITCGSRSDIVRVRTRSCNSPAPSNGGETCPGPSSETQQKTCNFSACPVDGQWSAWSIFSDPSCGITCGSIPDVNRVRTRLCNSPVPSNGGKSCPGLSLETKPKTCNFHVCPGCKTPLWGKGMISAGNDHVLYSGSTNAGWCPDPTLDAKSQYIEVTFPRKLGVKAIEIQPPQGTDPFYQGMSRHYLTNYTFQYTPYGATNLSTYGTQGGHVYQLGVRGNSGTVASTITEIVGLVTDRVRISIVDFVNQPCFRFDIFGCEPEELCTPACKNGGFCVYENTCACPPPFYGPGCKNTHLPVNSGCLKPLGMWSGDIKDSQLTASSSQFGKEKNKARYLCCLGEDRGAWCPSPNDTTPYYEVHLDKPYLVAMLMFQHPSKVNFWEVPDTFMTTFTLQYRNLELDRMETFAMNVDAIKSPTQALNPTFDPFILTDVIRIVPEKVNKEACFRFEIIGCDPDQGPDVPHSTPVSQPNKEGLIGVDLVGRRRRRHTRKGKGPIP